MDYRRILPCTPEEFDKAVEEHESRENSRRINVIIPSQNYANLVPCVEAVRKHEPDVRITVVDDTSAGDFGRFCSQNELDWVRGQKPFVYARNINLGIAEAFRHDTIDVTTHSSWEPEFLSSHIPHGVVLLNDDAILESPGGFSLMAQTCKDHTDFGIIGATTRVVGNRNQMPRGVGLREDPRMVCFFCVYIPRTTIEKVGYLDERFVGYGLDDDDYSLRVRKAGLRIGIHDGCYLDHGSLTSSYRGDPKAPADFKPNLARFVEKWGHDNFGRPA